jgi:Swt1-like HEPN/NACHT domain
MSDPGARAIADDAFRVLAQGLRPFVEERFRTTYGDDWKQRAGFSSAVGIGSAIRSLGDPGELLGQLGDWRLWDAVFRAGLVESADALATRGLVDVLRALRNDLYHHRPFEVSDAWRVVDNTRQLLRAVGGLETDRLTQLDGLEIRAGVVAAADRQPDLERLRAEYRESLLATTTYLEQAGISPSVGTRVVRVRAGDVYIVPHLTEEAPRGPTPRASNWMLEGDELRSLSWDQRHAVRQEGRRALEQISEQARTWRRPRPEESRSDNRQSVALGMTRVAIIGPPGSGKSSYLQYIARGTVLGTLEALRGRTPILIRVSRLAESLAAEPGMGVRRYILHRHTERFGELFGLELELGRALVLLDGIDEVASEVDRSRVLASIATFCGDHPSITVIVTSRPVRFRPAALGPGFTTFRIEPLNDDEVVEFCDRWLGILHEDDEGGGADASALVAEIGRVPGVEELATNPLLLTIIVLLWARGARLPQRRVDLYAAATETLLRDWPFRRLGESLDAPLLLSLLEPVAHTIVMTGAQSIGEVELVEQLSASLARLDGGAAQEGRERALVILDLVESHTDFFVEVGRSAGARRFGFIHRTFAEYLAARHLAELWGSGTLDLSAYLHQRALAETVRLFFAHVGSCGPSQASRALDELMSLEWPAESSVHKNLRLALSLLEDGLRVKAETRRAVLERAISAAVTTPDARIWTELLAAVRRLGAGIGLAARPEPLRPLPDDPPVLAARRALLALACEPDSDTRLSKAITAVEGLGDIAQTYPYDLVNLLDYQPDWVVRPAILMVGRWPQALSTNAFDRLANVGLPVWSAAEVAASAPQDPQPTVFLVPRAAQDLTLPALVALMDRCGAEFVDGLDLGADWDDEHAPEIVSLAGRVSDLPAELAVHFTYAVGHSGLEGIKAWASLFWEMVRKGGPELRIACLSALHGSENAVLSELREQVADELIEDPDAQGSALRCGTSRTRIRYGR